MCDAAYRAGVAQGAACDTDPSHYVEVYIRDFERRNRPPNEGVPIMDCPLPEDFVLDCGQAGSHDDGIADPFDYGYYDAWMFSDCVGDPVGADIAGLSWPPSRDPADPGWYRCPAESIE